jgi:hypothetical protein
MKQGLRPDPADIDGEQNKHETHGESETEHMLQELDGLNKYLQGVRVPNQLRQGGKQV